MIAAAPLDLASLESETAYNEAARSMVVEQGQAGCSFPEQKRGRSVAGGGLPLWGCPLGVSVLARQRSQLGNHMIIMMLSHFDVT